MMGRTILPVNHTIDLSVQSMDAYLSLFGMNDQNISLIEQECNVTVSLHGNSLNILGSIDLPVPLKPSRIMRREDASPARN